MKKTNASNADPNALIFKDTVSGGILSYIAGS